MDRRSFLASAGSASLATLMLAGGFAPLAQAAEAGGSADAQLTALLDRVFATFLENTPEYATILGLDKGAQAGLRAQLSDYSLAARARDVAQGKAQLAELHRIDRKSLGATGALHYDIVDYLLTTAVAAGERFPYGSNGIGYSPYVISQQDGVYQSLPDFLDSQHVVKTKTDADTYLARLEAFATALDQNSEAQRADAARGVFAPSFCLDTALAQLKALRDQPAAQTVLVSSIARRTKEAGIAGDYAARAEAIVTGKVFPALDRQIALVRELRARATEEAGVWRLPDGAAYYHAAVKGSTTTTLSPEEVHQLGLAQVADITAQLDSILKGQGMTRGSVGERLIALNSDPKQLYPNTDAGRAELLASLNEQIKALDSLLPKAFATLPKAPVEVVRVPAFIQDGAANGYYNSAALDGSRPAFYYINLKDTHDWPKYGLASLTYHEAMPGHHLQISLAQESPSTPMLLKLSAFGAYTEGWALYAEQIASELGVYDDDPVGRLGYLQSLAFRACRLVVDTGLHAKRWTRQQAISWFAESNGSSIEEVSGEVDRYCSWPGQACGYKIGHTEINRLRKKAQAALGDRYDFKAFNDAVVLGGSVPLTVLGRIIDRHIAERRA